MHLYQFFKVTKNLIRKIRNIMDDKIAYNGMLQQMRNCVSLLEARYKPRLSGSPNLTEVLIDYFRTYPDDNDVAYGMYLVRAYHSLNKAISSDKKRSNAFAEAVR